jgi:hypothetical protein
MDPHGDKIRQLAWTRKEGQDPDGGAECQGAGELQPRSRRSLTSSPAGRWSAAGFLLCQERGADEDVARSCERPG